MLVKKEFELIYKTTGKVQNIVDLNENTLRAYVLNKDEISYVKNLINITIRSKNYPFSKVVYEEIDKMVWVNLPLYPLPGFVTNRGLAVCNTASLAGKTIIDYNSIDVFSICSYTIALSKYLKNKPFNKSNINTISDMYFSIFMKFFGKKSGLIGSYKHLIPQLRFLINLYVSIGLIGEQQNKKLFDKISAEYMLDYNNMDLNYDFSSIVQFLKCVNKNNILSISENTFSTDIINRFGINSLPMFEDVSRFYATVIAVSVTGNSIFSGMVKKINTTLYDRILYLAQRAL